MLHCALTYHSVHLLLIALAAYVLKRQPTFTIEEQRPQPGRGDAPDTAAWYSNTAGPRMQKLETRADLCDKLSGGWAASQQVVSAPLQAGQMSLGGGRAGKSPRYSNHGPCQLRGSDRDGECQLQIACSSVTCSEGCAGCRTGLCLHHMSLPKRKWDKHQG